VRRCAGVPLLGSLPTAERDERIALGHATIGCQIIEPQTLEQAETLIRLPVSLLELAPHLMYCRETGAYSSQPRRLLTRLCKLGGPSQGDEGALCITTAKACSAEAPVQIKQVLCAVGLGPLDGIEGHPVGPSAWGSATESPVQVSNPTCQLRLRGGLERPNTDDLVGYPQALKAVRAIALAQQTRSSLHGVDCSFGWPIPSREVPREHLLSPARPLHHVGPFTPRVGQETVEVSLPGLSDAAEGGLPQ
jgi:hypothetical protein